MYTLHSPLQRVQGIGPKLAETLEAAGCVTVLDLLLQLPLRYEDRSQFFAIADAPKDTLITIKGHVANVRTYYKNRRPISSAKVTDDTGTVTLMWFNNSFVKTSLKNGEEYMFSGKINDRKTMVQPLFERASDNTIHTNRLIPLYSSTLQMKQGTLRRILKNITEHLAESDDPVAKLAKAKIECLELGTALTELHFPTVEENVVAARERLALEELLALIQHSNKLKKEWKELGGAESVKAKEPLIPDNLPFELTGAQQRCVSEIMEDLAEDAPMNRILIGDVGSGKTIVAGIACSHTLAAGNNAALVAPTQILAEQHVATLQKLFPELPIVLITGKNKFEQQDQPALYVGTHAVINKLTDIKPALIIYDEQHRFGVEQRSQAQKLKPFPHILTMTATPIPRTLLLTIFSHLAVSVIDELPKNRIPTKTWVLPEPKRTDMYDWIAEQIAAAGKGKFQTLVICPFIDPSSNEALENVASTKEKFAEVQSYFKGKAKVGILHGRLSVKDKNKVIQELFDQKLDILVTTPIVEVGIDLPQAAAIVIESSERFGLASLHQLRGRVGRAGQQGYCMLFTHSKSKGTKDRLQKFSEITNGQELAELDLQNRGAGDIFGVEQSGFGELQFASWTNFALVKLAQDIERELADDWKPVLTVVQKEEKSTLAN